MKCPFCASINNKVIDSRLSKDEHVIRRRRECIDCGRRFTTYERVEEIHPLVIKKDNGREPFDRIKILNGLKRACEKRPISLEMIERMTDKVEKLVLEYEGKEIPSRQIGDWVMKELQRVDGVAYVRFASVYREFKDINEFMEEVKDLFKERRAK